MRWGFDTDATVVLHVKLQLVKKQVKILCRKGQKLTQAAARLSGKSRKEFSCLGG